MSLASKEVETSTDEPPLVEEVAHEYPQGLGLACVVTALVLSMFLVSQDCAGTVQ